MFAFITGALFILAGLRNFFAPGFLCISSRPDTAGTGYLIVGGLFLLFGFLCGKRLRRQDVLAK
jgi:hypothetical protein